MSDARETVGELIEKVGEREALITIVAYSIRVREALVSLLAQYLETDIDCLGPKDIMRLHYPSYEVLHIHANWKPKPQPRDREPQPSDGPDYHADRAAWQERQNKI